MLLGSEREATLAIVVLEMIRGCPDVRPEHRS